MNDGKGKTGSKRKKKRAGKRSVVHGCQLFKAFMPCVQNKTEGKNTLDVNWIFLIVLTRKS